MACYTDDVGDKKLIKIKKTISPSDQVKSFISQPVRSSGESIAKSAVHVEV